MWGIILGVISIVVAVVGLWLNRMAMAAENARHLEDIKRQDEIRKADAEQDRLQRDNQQKFYLAQQREKKNSLVLNMLTEIHSIQNFLVITPQLHISGNYSLGVHAIVGTVPQQVSSFSNQTVISKLTEYRNFLNQLIEMINRANSISPLTVNSAAAAANGVSHADWNPMIRQGKQLNSEVLALLLPEYSGDVPEHLKKLRMG